MIVYVLVCDFFPMCGCCRLDAKAIESLCNAACTLAHLLQYETDIPRQQLIFSLREAAQRIVSPNADFLGNFVSY
jgi:hypothetical protein